LVLEVVEAGEGVVAFGAEALVLGVEVLVLGGEPAPAAVLGCLLTASAVELGLQRLRLVLRRFQLGAEIPDGLPRPGEFVSVIEGLGQGGWLWEAGLAVPPGALTVGVGSPLAWASSFAGDRHQVGA
jgi:hypothetical protein